MTDEIDAGIDKQKILAEIGASAPMPLASAGSMPAPAAVPAVAPPEPAPGPLRPASTGRLVRHRSRIAAMVMVFAALLWMSVGLATHERAPFALGGGFLGLAIFAVAGPLLRER